MTVSDSAGAATPTRTAALRMLRCRWPLVVLCVGLAAGEAVALQVTGFRSAMPLAPQLAAPGSLGAYHDLRWLMTYSWSWEAVAWQLIALLVCRTLVTVGIIVLAWPTGRPRTPWPQLLRRNLAAIVIAVVTLSPWAAAGFAAQAMSYSKFMILSIIAGFVTMLMLPLVVVGRWWRRALLWRTAGWTATAWLAAMIEAMAIAVSPSWVAVAAAAAGGLLNAVIWMGLVRTIALAPEPTGRWSLAPAAILAVLALFLVGGGFAIGSGALGSSPAQQPPPATDGRPVLFVSGFGTSYDGGPSALFGSDRRLVTRYSYRGLGPDGPLPFGPIATTQPIEDSADKLAAQLQWLAARSRTPVVLIADSEGNLVARAYFARHRDPPVTDYIMASPLPRPARVYYPAPGQTGWGVLPAREADGLLSMLHLENPQTFLGTPDMPFTRSIVDHAALFRPGTLCPASAGVRTWAFIPLAGATVVYHGPISHVPWTALPGWHADLLHRGGVGDDIERLITTGHLVVHNSSTGAFRALSGAAAAWQVPALPVALHPQWRAAPHTDPAFADWTCPG